MAYLQGLDGLGRGMMQGLELSRRHRFQDEEQARQNRLEERQAELHGLNVRQAEGNIEFNEQYRPVQLEQAQVGLESTRSQMAFNEQRRPLQLEQDRLGLATGQHQLSQAQQEAAMQDWRQGVSIAILAAEQGDVNAINSWLANNPMGEQGMFDVSEDGSIRLLFSPDPNSDEVLERPIDPRELPSIIRTIAGMEQPEPVKGININGHLVNPHTGEEMGDFRTPKQRGGAGGAGGLDSSSLTQIQQSSRYFHGTFNPDGSFLGIPEGAREKYTLSMQRSQELVSAGLPLFEAINLANLSTLDGTSEAEARRIAENEAKQQFGGMFKGSEREAYIQQRVPELLQEGRQALQQYEQIIQGRGAPQGGMQMPGTQPQAGLPTPQATQEQAPAMIARQPEGRAPQGQGMQMPQAQDLQDFMPGGLLNRQNINDTAGARFGRGIRESFDNTMGMVARDWRGENGLGILGTVNPQAEGSVVNYAVRGIDTAARGADSVGRNITGFVSSIASPGVSSDQIPPAIGNIESAMQNNQRPSREDVIQAVEFATQYPDALSADGLGLLSYLAEQEGL